MSSCGLHIILVWLFLPATSNGFELYFIYFMNSMDLLLLLRICMFYVNIQVQSHCYFVTSYLLFPIPYNVKSCQISHYTYNSFRATSLYRDSQTRIKTLNIHYSYPIYLSISKYTIVIIFRKHLMSRFDSITVL